MKLVNIKYGSGSIRTVRLPETLSESDKCLLDEELVSLLVKDKSYDKELPELVLTGIQARRKDGEPKAQAKEPAKAAPKTYTEAPKKKAFKK